MDPLHNHAVSCSFLSPEQLTQVLSTDEEIKNAVQLQKKCFVDYKKCVEMAKKAQDECVGSSESLFSRTSLLIRNKMPRLQDFTEDHELAIRDFIYFDVFEWHPTDHNFWILKKNEQIRRDPKSFQAKNKKLGGSVATIVHTLQLRHNKARLKLEIEKTHAVMPQNEDNTNDTIEGQFDFKIDVLHMDERIESILLVGKDILFFYTSCVFILA